MEEMKNLEVTCGADRIHLDWENSNKTEDRKLPVGAGN